MTFPLGSLRSEGGASRSLAHSGNFGRSTAGSAGSAHRPASWRAQLGLLAFGVVWLLAALALATHNGADAAFSTSGTAPVALNRAGWAGAWFSDLAYFLFGYSVWWAMAVTLRCWLAALTTSVLKRSPRSCSSARWPGFSRRYTLRKNGPPNAEWLAL